MGAGIWASIESIDTPSASIDRLANRRRIPSITQLFNDIFTQSSLSKFETIILVECLALWGERERSRRQYRSQVSVFKSALFTEHSNTDKMKKRRTVADSVANVGESGDRNRCLGTSVAYLGVNTRP